MVIITIRILVLYPEALTKLVDRKAMLPSVTEVRVAKSPLR